MKKFACLVSLFAVFTLFYAAYASDKYEECKIDSSFANMNVSLGKELTTCAKGKTFEVVEVVEEKEDDFAYIEEIPLGEEWQRFVWDICYEADVSVSLVYGVIKQESGFIPDAVSYDGHDFGLMQIRDSNHEWLNSLVGEDLDYKDEYENVKAGVRLLSDLCDTYNGDEVKVLMAYNMGPTGASKLWNKGVYSTQYTENVMNNKEYFEEVLNERIQD